MGTHTTTSHLLVIHIYSASISDRFASLLTSSRYYYYEYTIVVQVGDEMTVWPRVSLDVAQYIPTAPTVSLITDRKVYKAGDIVSLKGDFHW
jgi:hypothetical protein